jgi:hypothetical protein
VLLPPPHLLPLPLPLLLLSLSLLSLLLPQPPPGPPPDAGGCRAGAITCWDLALLLTYLGLVGCVVAGVVVRRKRLQQQYLEASLGLEGGWGVCCAVLCCSVLCCAGLPCGAGKVLGWCIPSSTCSCGAQCGTLATLGQRQHAANGAAITAPTA